MSLDEVMLILGQSVAAGETSQRTRGGFQVNMSVRLLLDLALATDHILLYRHGNMQKPTEVWGATPVCRAREQQEVREQRRRGALLGIRSGFWGNDAVVTNASQRHPKLGPARPAGGRGAKSRFERLRPVFSAGRMFPGGGSGPLASGRQLCLWFSVDSGVRFPCVQTLALPALSGPPFLPFHPCFVPFSAAAALKGA